jgi:hypothetical protein
VDNVDAGYAEYVRKWAELAEREGIQLILYITAPHAQNMVPVEGPAGSEQTEMEMRMVRQLAGRIQPCAVVPVALGIEQVQKDGTDLKFRYVNDMHLNQYCAFLTANMFYAAVFKESPEGFAFDTVIENNPKGMGEGKDPDGNDAAVTFDRETKELLQHTAYDAVMKFNKGME